MEKFHNKEKGKDIRRMLSQLSKKGVAKLTKALLFLGVIVAPTIAKGDVKNVDIENKEGININVDNTSVYENTIKKGAFNEDVENSDSGLEESRIQEIIKEINNTDKKLLEEYVIFHGFEVSDTVPVDPKIATALEKEFGYKLWEYKEYGGKENREYFGSWTAKEAIDTLKRLTGIDLTGIPKKYDPSMNGTEMNFGDESPLGPYGSLVFNFGVVKNKEYAHIVLSYPNDRVFRVKLKNAYGKEVTVFYLKACKNLWMPFNHGKSNVIEKNRPVKLNETVKIISPKIEQEKPQEQYVIVYQVENAYLIFYSNQSPNPGSRSTKINQKTGVMYKVSAEDLPRVLSGTERISTGTVGGFINYSEFKYLVHPDSDKIVKNKNLLNQYQTYTPKQQDKYLKQRAEVKTKTQNQYYKNQKGGSQGYKGNYRR